MLIRGSESEEQTGDRSKARKSPVFKLLGVRRPSRITELIKIGMNKKEWHQLTFKNGPLRSPLAHAGAGAKTQKTLERGGNMEKLREVPRETSSRRYADPGPNERPGQESVLFEVDVAYGEDGASPHAITMSRHLAWKC